MSTEQTVHLAVLDTLADWEVGHAIAHLTKPDWQQQPGRYQVRTVGLGDRPITTMGGVRILPDLTVDQVDPADSAMLILPGADLWHTTVSAPFVELAGRCLAAGTPVAAICGATYALAEAGLLDHHAHTSNAREYLAHTGYAGASRYRDQPRVITDGDLITGSGTQPALFARAILERLDVYTPEVLASWWKLYGHDDPAGFHELMAVAA